MFNHYDSMGQSIEVGDVITHTTGSGHAMNVSAGVITKLTEEGIHATVVDTVYHGVRTGKGGGLRNTFYKDGKYTTLTSMQVWEFEEMFGVRLEVRQEWNEPVSEAMRLVPNIWAGIVEESLRDPGFSEALDRAEAAMKAESAFVVSILGNDPVADFVKEQWEGTGFEASASLDFEY